jgi:hypothetical protein
VTTPVLVAWWVAPPPQPILVSVHRANPRKMIDRMLAFANRFLAKTSGKRRSGRKTSEDDAAPDTV